MHRPFAFTLTVTVAGLLLWLPGLPTRAQAAASPVPAAVAPSVAPSRAPSAPGPSAVPSADESALLQTFGQREGLQNLAADFVQRARADARTSAFFSPVKPQHLAQQLADQFCAVLNGPCTYDGETMKNAHAGLDIARKDFLATVELLQAAMDSQGVPFAAQNKLLARLAPMHRDIISR